MSGRRKSRTKTSRDRRRRHNTLWGQFADRRLAQIQFKWQKGALYPNKSPSETDIEQQKDTRGSHKEGSFQMFA